MSQAFTGSSPESEQKYRQGRAQSETQKLHLRLGSANGHPSVAIAWLPLATLGSLSSSHAVVTCYSVIMETQPQQGK